MKYKNFGDAMDDEELALNLLNLYAQKMSSLSLDELLDAYFKILSKIKLEKNLEGDTDDSDF
ncbi:MAG: hypothetical protein QXH23_01780 [archaeon]